MAEKDPSSVDELLKKKIRTKEHGEQSIKLAEWEISRICEELGIDNTTSQLAYVIYNRSLDEKFIENRTIGMVAAASVYTACRIENELPTPQEISKFAVDTQAGISKEAMINRVYSEQSICLNIKLGPIDPTELIPNITSELNVSDECEYKAKKILNDLDDEVMSGKAPTSLAGGAVYLSALLVNNKRTQEEVAEASNVSVSTINYVYKDLAREVLDH